MRCTFRYKVFYSSPVLLVWSTLIGNSEKKRYALTRLKGFANQVKVQPKEEKKRRGGPKRTSNGLTKHHQNESSPQRPLSRSNRFLWILQKSRCLPNWQAAPSQVFDLARHHYDAPNWYRFVPDHCRWNIIWSVPPVSWRCSCLAAISTPGAKNKYPRQALSQSLLAFPFSPHGLFTPCKYPVWLSDIFPDTPRCFALIICLNAFWGVDLCLLFNVISISDIWRLVMDS